MRRIFLLGLSILTGIAGYTQNEDDALRYSMIYFGGSARNMGMAGAFSAIGGDQSTVLQNPAGLGRFKKDNISFTTNVEHAATSSDFYGTMRGQNGMAFNISNFSYVNAYELNPNEFNNWYGVQIGFGYNRIQSFEERFTYQGNSDSSILHSFINEANGTHPDNIYDVHPFTAGLAYDVYALDPGAGNTYVTDFTSGSAFHQRTVTREGGMGEYNFTLSGNYANKLLLGGSFNLTRVRFYESYQHNETFSDTSLWLRSIRYTGDLGIEGWGYNLRAGAIFFPKEWIRIGAAIQTPTVFYLRDSWSNNMSAQTDDGLKSVDPAYVPYGNYDYKVRTPFRANMSVGLVMKKLGSFGAEVEFVDYGQGFLSSRRYSNAPYSFNAENAQIDNIYQSVLNYKAGLELRLTNQWYLRGGYAYYPSPYKASSGNQQYATTFYTGGLGYNFGKFYMDFAYVMKNQKKDYYAYDPTITGSKSTIDYRNSRYLLTMGFRF